MSTSKGIAQTQYTSSPGGGPVGGLSGSVALFSDQFNPKVLDVSPEGVLDWFIPYQGGFQTDNTPGVSKGGSVLCGRLAEFYRLFGASIGIGSQGSLSTTVSSDAADSAGPPVAANNNGNCLSQADVTHFNYGFEIQAPASAKSFRNVNLYIILWGGGAGNSRTAKIIASLTDESAAELDLVFVDPGSNGNIAIYKATFNFKAGTPGANLRLQVIVTAGTSVSNSLGLLAATMF